VFGSDAWRAHIEAEFAGLSQEEQFARGMEELGRKESCASFVKAAMKRGGKKLLETDSKDGPQPAEKDFFMIFFAGDVLREKVSKISSYFGANLYKFPEVTHDYLEMKGEVNRRLFESKEVMTRGDMLMRNVLVSVGVAFPTWSYVCDKQKMSYDALNKCEFDIKRHVFIAEVWVPKSRFSEVEHGIFTTAIRSGLETLPIINKLKTKLTPPTYLPTTSFSNGFQALVNTYGTPRYREANPGAFCCIMFPFLFGIMFGDFGHGLLLAAFGFWLITKEKEWEGKPLNDMVAMCYGGRYVILLNGLFGAYVGLCYNEAFAFPMNFFGGSRWREIGPDFGLPPSPPDFMSLHPPPAPPPADVAWPHILCQHASYEAVQTVESPNDGQGCFQNGQYPMGIDPIWHQTDNKITFFNSYKMKISIVVGVLQMTVGIVLSVTNHFEFKDYKRVIFQFLPEFVFFQSIFGYLVFTIIYKWAVDWNDQADPQVAPSLLTMLIDMFMSPTSDIEVPLYGHKCFTDCGAAASARDDWTIEGRGYCDTALVAAACPVTCGAQAMEPGVVFDTLHGFDDNGVQTKICFSPLQSTIQFWLLIAAFVAVPFLLFPIPFIELAEANAKRKSYKDLDDEKESHGGGGGGSGGGGDDGEFSFGDAFIHQAIHTIEFVLGSISNTASYLRLWALSLAHSQLAELFKEMILIDAGVVLEVEDEATGKPVPLLGAYQFIMTFFCFGAFAVISFVVLMVMENLSSFLHALRLQWVEFQNKFFYGDGQKYAPLDFKNLKKTLEEE